MLVARCGPDFWTAKSPKWKWIFECCHFAQTSLHPASECTDIRSDGRWPNWHLRAVQLSIFFCYGGLSECRMVDLLCCDFCFTHVGILTRNQAAVGTNTFRNGIAWTSLFAVPAGSWYGIRETLSCLSIFDKRGLLVSDFTTKAFWADSASLAEVGRFKPSWCRELTCESGSKHVKSPYL